MKEIVRDVPKEYRNIIKELIEKKQYNISKKVLAIILKLMYNSYARKND